MGSELAGCDAGELGRVAVGGLLARSGIDPAVVDETILGCVGQPADQANLARVVALRAGIPEAVPAMTVHRNCASGLESLLVAHQRLVAGRGEVFVVGGTESMSNYPLQFRRAAVAKFAALTRSRSLSLRLAALSAFKPADFAPEVALKLGLTDPVAGLGMGETAEVLAREFGIPRVEQDAFAARSHVRALQAREAGHLAEEIVPVFPGGGVVVEEDNGIRNDSTPEKLATLRPAFASAGDRPYGTVTAGNSSQITDGAVALLVMSERRARELQLQPLARLVDYAVTGCAPRRMGLGPVGAIGKVLATTGLDLDALSIIEINEAFAVQVLAVTRKLEADGLGRLDPERLNRCGGAIALGHPVGASGARLVLTALHQLRRFGGGRALVSLCVGGGQGVAALFEASG
jgi:acetyl-CoA C-acetyltransferase/acetyl-CoA acyltransferase